MSRSALAVLVAGLSALPTHAATIHVPGDYPKLSQAVAAAVAGDSVAVGPGTHTDDVTVAITIPLTVYSTAGAEATVLDGERVRRILDSSSAGVLVQGLSFVRGRGVGITTSAGALIDRSGAVVMVEDCSFRNCVADQAAAVYVSDSSRGLGTAFVARRCLFASNSTTVTGGAVFVVLGAVATFESCTFRENDTRIGAGAVHAHRATMNFDGCLFHSNRSEDIAGGLYYGTLGAGFVRRCTFVGHTSPGSISGTIVAGAGAAITRSLFVGDTRGFGIRWYTGEGAHSCNAFWNNADGAMGGGFPNPSEVVADPLFCDAPAGGFHVRSDSPCAPDHSGSCGLIGAFDVACGPVSIAPESWGQIKGRYRSRSLGSD